MTEAAANVVENAVPDSTPELTPEQKAEQTKAALQMAFQQSYVSLITLLNNVQGHPQLKMHCFQNLDQAGFWAREFIHSANFNFAPAPAPAPADNVTPITDAKVEEPSTETVKE